MKRVFVVLSLCLGFSVAFGLDGTLSIQSIVRHPQTGAKTTINLGTYIFDVFKDRRELVREVDALCKNPPEKIKTFIANRTNLGDTSIKIYFGFKDYRIDEIRNDESKKGFRDMLKCEYNEGKLYKVGYRNNDYRLNQYTLDEIVQKGAERVDFTQDFARFIDFARAEAKAKDINVTTPNKTITIKFGTRVINPETGAEGISTYPSLDYEFNVYDDRKDLWKKVWDACAIQLRGTILNEIKNGNKSPTMSVWYEHPQGGLAELETLQCFFNENGKYIITMAFKKFHEYQKYLKGQISPEKVSKEAIEEWADEKKAKDGYFDEISFNRDFMMLIDAANAGTKQPKK